MILEVAVEQHPQRLTAGELTSMIVSDANDSKEVEIAFQAIAGLREHSLFEDRDDGIVEPTPAALRAVPLLTSPSAHRPNEADP